MHHLAHYDLLLAQQRLDVHLHLIQLTVTDTLGVIDFRHVDRLFTLGYEQAMADLR